jgi:ABC-type sugar transport system substrate-binding protein
MPSRRLGVRTTAALAGLAAALTLGCGKSDDRAAAPPHGRVAAVIKGLDNPFFATMRAGLVATAQGNGAQLDVAAAAGLQDTAGQASTLESLVAQRPGCYVVNPITPTNLIPPLTHLPESTPIVNIDSPVDRDAASAAGVRIRTYIGTDNVAAGRRAAATMARFVRRGARVAVVAGIPGDETSAARERGFRAGARGRFAVTQTVAADFDRQRARLAAAELLRADRRLRGVFAVNDQMALGIADAVRARRRRRAVAVIGLDGIREALDAVARGALAATVAQYPYAIGRLGVEACLVALRGKALPRMIAAPVQVVTRENVARAKSNFPAPVAPFRDPLTRLLAD